ncbi:MAG TPA: hypothetical protein VJV79_00945 [Polyangiaceae bacterium]|nr:hypothetical protein [Polyangiaceae bacterium]
MLKQGLVWGGLTWLLLLCASSCSDKPSCEGKESCACYANSTCNAGLDCRSNLCVNLNGAGGASGSGLDSKACLACAETACASAASACKAASGCETMLSCLLECGTDAACLANCVNGVSPDGVAKAGMYQACAFTMCTKDCTYVPTGIGGFGNGSGGSSSSAGASSKAGNGSTSGGSNGVGGTGTAGAGDPPSEPVSGVNWLSITGATAPSGNGVNGKLGIDGVFYAYADPCASLGMSWDPTTRCLSGLMCAADTTGTNWGVAIGFDFNNVDSVKRAWNAGSHGVTGVAWKTSVSRLQVWIQNMDPSFNGTCTSADCNINAPPDGKRSAQGMGQFSFASMEKDVWGPDAASYDFDSANVSALQFKIAAEPSAFQYSLCVHELGVVR